jgi:LysM repeat protein
MARRSPARLLAPLALVGFVIALLVVVNSSSTGGGSSASESRPAATKTTTPKKGKSAHKVRRRYTVKPGDTPSGIAEKTGVPLSKILELNPDLDDQSLTVGDKIKLR